jgi:two-component system sensor histidine kinase/response regulator
MKLILLIDDDEGVRLTFGGVLRDHGYRVIESDSGEAGLELARQQMPDLILTDINMPGGDGQALLHHIRSDVELSGTQVVLMTGRPDMVSPRRGMAQGADDFLVKPVTGDDLLTCMEGRLKRGEVHWRVEDRVLAGLRSSMTAQLPHEFITPLAGILGLSEILKSDFASLSDEEMQEFHNDIHQSALRLQRTVKNYLLMLELEPRPGPEGETTLPPPLPFEKAKECIIQGVNSAVDRHGRKEDITVHVEKCSIMVNGLDLAYIVEELVDNALKFSRTGSPVEVRLESEGVLLVTDSGRGMLSEEIEKIGAFRQFDRKKYEQQGLGLGLILVQRLAARNGASVALISLPERGVQDKVIFARDDSRFLAAPNVANSSDQQAN